LFRWHGHTFPVHTVGGAQAEQPPLTAVFEAADLAAEWSVAD
jgi:hypothetical protein